MASANATNTLAGPAFTRSTTDTASYYFYTEEGAYVASMRLPAPPRPQDYAEVKRRFPKAALATRFAPHRDILAGTRRVAKRDLQRFYTLEAFFGYTAPIAAPPVSTVNTRWHLLDHQYRFVKSIDVPVGLEYVTAQRVRHDKAEDVYYFTTFQLTDRQFRRQNPVAAHKTKRLTEIEPPPHQPVPVLATLHLFNNSRRHITTVKTIKSATELLADYPEAVYTLLPGLDVPAKVHSGDYKMARKSLLLIDGVTEKRTPPAPKAPPPVSVEQVVAKLKAAAHEEVLTVTVPKELLEQVLPRLQEQGTTIDAFVRMALKSYAKKPIEYKLADPLGFGKYAGETLEEVMRVYPDYIRWCLENVGGFQLAADAQKLLKKLHPGFTAPNTNLYA